MILIGGTSNVGKSTVARAVAERLGFGCLSTDGLARHPGRPWRTPEREVPAHVAEHYASLTVDELITSVLGHYERLWSRIEDLIMERAAEGGGTGLVLEGSALWPVRVAELEVPRTAAVWLTADDAVVRARVHTAGRYETAADEEQRLMDKFLARTERYQALMIDDIGTLGLDRIDVGDGRPVAGLVDSVLAAVDAQHAVGRSGLSQPVASPAPGPASWRCPSGSGRSPRGRR
ncbi:AAA family ATPase [Streptomyces phyllanthi]|uniref:AAA family ATPase n=1 Tax=Streptomyces phyllanthi TaxID=1803180 RepID=A0A5N8WBX0_9ACTN|nr:AAA family ATPase [Streptomyces phyllanthi]